MITTTQATVSVAVAAQIAGVETVTIRVWRYRGYLTKRSDGQVVLVELLARLERGAA